MTVKELMEILQRHDSNLEVIVRYETYAMNRIETVRIAEDEYHPHAQCVEIVAENS